MAGLNELLSRDHDRLDGLLAASVRADGAIDSDRYAAFRAGLLWHIAVEEKVLFRAIRKERGDTRLLEQLHRDHAALAALLVPPPAVAEIETIRTILARHNPLEEDAGGLYELADRLSVDLLPLVQAVPPVIVAPHADTPTTRRSIEQLVREAEEGSRRL
jgi:hypothetical protein